jgi:hypothetical protein
VKVVHAFGYLHQPVDKSGVREVQLPEFEHFVDCSIWHEFRYKKPLLRCHAFAAVPHNVSVAQYAQDSRLLLVHSRVEKLLDGDDLAFPTTFVHDAEGAPPDDRSKDNLLSRAYNSPDRRMCGVPAETLPAA